jgi:hypothetical protein
MPKAPQPVSRIHNSRYRNAQRPIWFHIRKDFSLGFAVELFPPPAKLRRPAPIDLHNRGNKECKQGDHKYDLRSGECGPRDDPEAEQASDQSNDKKGNRPVKKHDGLLTPS